MRKLSKREVIAMIAIYLRVSTNKQETTAQRHEIDKWIKQQGYDPREVMEYVDQGLSGKVETTEKRDGLKRLLDDVKGGKIRKLITFEMSRLSRDFMTFLNMMALFTEKGVLVEVPGQGVQLFESSTDKLIMAVKGFVANQFLEDHSRRVKAGMAAAKKGDPEKRYGAPVGNTFNKGKRKEHDPDLVKNVLKLSSKGLSSYEIAEALKITQTMASRLVRRYKASA